MTIFSPSVSADPTRFTQATARPMVSASVGSYVTRPAGPATESARAARAHRCPYPRPMRRGRAIALALVGAAAVAAVVALLVPTHPERGLLTLVGRLLPPGSLADGSPLWWAFESVGNVALFVPVGIGAALILGPARGLFVAVVVSAACELAQHWIPDRNASLSDVLLNSIGAAVGVALAVAVRSRTARRQATRA